MGDAAPNFTLPASDGTDWNLSDHLGKTVVLLFYPRDNTPVCTKQLCSVRDHWADYRETGAEIVGISADDVDSHKEFAAKKNFPFKLLADTRGEVIAKYGAKSWVPGRAARAVVVIDKDGRLAYHRVQPLSIFKPTDDDVLAAIRAA
jgi:thioredoxin-dependent peroxiredoxin